MRSLTVRQFTHYLDYTSSWEAMKRFTRERDSMTVDELWLLEHYPVFTQGQAGKPEHILKTGGIPIVQADRGGQVTYHGPGQLIAYALLDIRRLDLSVRALVHTIESIVIECLSACQIESNRCQSAPGVYVQEAKICSIGLRVSRGCSYHGLAFNVDMDLTPFNFINPCGYSGLKMTQVKNWRPRESMASIQEKIISCFVRCFRYNQFILVEQNKLESI